MLCRSNVELSENVELISNVHIEGNTKIGKGTKIFPFASIGTIQDLKYKGESKVLKLENNIIREYVTINPGTSGGGKTTLNNVFMISSHIVMTVK